MAERKFTDLELERMLANELPADRARQLEESATAADRERLDQLRAEHQAFLAQVHVPDEVRAIGRRVAALTPRPSRPWWHWLIAGGGLAAATATLLLVIHSRAPAPPATDDDLEVKGGGVALIVHTPQRQLATGDTVRPGDRLRFEISANVAGYVAVIGIDGTQVPTVYVPDHGMDAIAFDPQRQRIMPGAIELDATPGNETYYAVFAEHPFSTATVLPGLQRGTAVPGMTVARVVLHKQL